MQPGPDALVEVIAPCERADARATSSTTTRVAPPPGGGSIARWRQLREAGIPADGHVVDQEPLSAVKDAIAMEEPDELIVSTHPDAKSGWRRRNLIDEIRKAAGDRPVEHVVSDVASRTGETNVLVVANETVLGEPLLDRIRQKSRDSRRPGDLPDHLSAERSRSRRRIRRRSGGCGPR